MSASNPTASRRRIPWMTAAAVAVVQVLATGCERPPPDAGPDAGRTVAPAVSPVDAPASRAGTPTASALPASAAPAASAPTDAWVGQWNGPEGTFLRIAGRGGRYELTVQNLDGPSTFAGTAASDGIRFERQGRTEVLRATQGPETGMKWLADKRDCLTVRSGEGYCRD